MRLPASDSARTAPRRLERPGPPSAARWPSILTADPFFTEVPSRWGRRTCSIRRERDTIRPWWAFLTTTSPGGEILTRPTRSAASSRRWPQAGSRASWSCVQRSIARLPNGATRTRPSGARAAYLHFQSVANQVRFVQARDALADTAHRLSEDDRRRRREQIRQIAADERALARELFTLTRLDSRIGFEASNQYVYLPLDLVEKTINCDWIERD